MSRNLDKIMRVDRTAGGQCSPPLILERGLHTSLSDVKGSKFVKETGPPDPTTQEYTSHE